jgi:hypothetical protein
MSETVWEKAGIVLVNRRLSDPERRAYWISAASDR